MMVARTALASGMLIPSLAARGSDDCRELLHGIGQRHELKPQEDPGNKAQGSSLQEHDNLNGTVAGFKGLERSAIVLAVDGFHEGLNPAQVTYVGMSRARDLLVVVGDPQEIERAVGPAVMKRLMAYAK